MKTYNQIRHRQMQDNAAAPQKGDWAPDFELEELDGRSRHRLSSYRGNMPVVLVFGSYT